MQKLRVADRCVAAWEEMAPSPVGRRCDRCRADVHDLRFVTEARAHAVVLLFGGDRPPCIRLRVDAHGDAVFRTDRAPARRGVREPAIVAAALATLSAGCGAGTSAETVAAPAVCTPVAQIREEAPVRVPITSEVRSAAPAPDSDGDGLADSADACPNDPADATGVDGCPPARRVVVVVNGGASVMEQVHFAINATALTPQATRILQEITKILTEHPEITLVNVVGHASPDELNPTRVAANRAAVTVKYLVARGIDPSRLTASGAAATRPIGDNTSAEGRAQNRRIEFAIQHP